MSRKERELPRLYVEGKSDLHSLLHILLRNQVALNDKSGPVVLKEEGGIEGVLKAIQLEAVATIGRPVGFVVDADPREDDGSRSNVWERIRGALGDTVGDLPDAPPGEGFVSQSRNRAANLGIWVMPDNVRAGTLEQFIEESIPKGDLLFGHAGDSTAEAQRLGAKFGPRDFAKARLHCWLAWQIEPGEPYGTAYRAEILDAHTGLCLAFVAWFRRLYAGHL